MFKELFTESELVYIDDDTSRWGIDADMRKFGVKFGKLFAVFFTKQNWRDGRASERWCFKDSSIKGYNPGPEFEVCRYVSRVTMAGKMAPICAINPDKGLIKFLKDSNGEDKSFSRPLKVQYMRISARDI